MSLLPFGMAALRQFARIERPALAGAPALLGDAVGAMYCLKMQAEALMRIPLDGGLETAGPTFEWVPPDERR